MQLESVTKVSLLHTPQRGFRVRTMSARHRVLAQSPRQLTNLLSRRVASVLCVCADDALVCALARFLPLQSRWFLPLLVLCSPFLFVAALMSLPLVLIALPLAALAAVGWMALGPVGGQKHTKRSVIVGEPEHAGEGAPRRNIQWASELTSTKDGCTTIPQLMRATFERYGSSPALGTRSLIKTVAKEVTVTVDGKAVTKTHQIPWMTDYNFNTFTELGQQISDFGAGLTRGTQTPLEFGAHISIFAGTRPEWQVSAQAAFEQGLVVVTVYPSLGPEALSYSLNQTEASHLICQASLMDIVARSAGSLKPSLRCIIYMDTLTPTQVQEYQKKLGREVLAWSDVLARGREINASDSSSSSSSASKKPQRRAPQPKDLAVVMYTSGSTGQPKGVMMSHANVVAAISGIGKVVPDQIDANDVYIGYLPLAHVLELTAEMTVLSFGGSIGYSSPLTLRDDGVCDAEGKPAGDLGKLRPTLMAAVPLILDRLRAGVQDQVHKGPLLKRLLFKAAYYIKKRRYLAGKPSPILDKIVFSKVAARFGGRVRYLLSGECACHRFSDLFLLAICVTQVACCQWCSRVIHWCRSRWFVCVLFRRRASLRRDA